MAIIKSFTSLEQSKKLAEILPLESADMHYCLEQRDIASGYEIGITPYIKAKSFIGKCNIIDVQPSWSLASLLGVLPSATLDSSDDHHYRVHCNERFTDWYDNPIDCCVAMINRLHEQMIYDFNNK